MDIASSYLWLIAGVVFMALEALGAPGVGFLFAGLGAVTVGSTVYFGMVAEDATVLQFTLFFVATAAWAFLLWKPLQKFHLSNKPQGYSNMVGDTAYVGSSGLHMGKEGEVTWSGTIMKARLESGASVMSLAPGDAVIITDVKGATLIVKPK